MCYQYAVGLNAAKPFGNETLRAPAAAVQVLKPYQVPAVGLFANDHNFGTLYANPPSAEGEGRLSSRIAV